MDTTCAMSFRVLTEFAAVSTNWLTNDAAIPCVQSGQHDETARNAPAGTVNLLAIAFSGSNPLLSTILARKGLRNRTASNVQPARMPGHRLARRCPAGLKASTTTRTITTRRMGAASYRLREGVALRSRWPLAGVCVQVRRQEAVKS